MKIFVAGHNGMVGSAIVRYLRATCPTVQIETRTREELDLVDQRSVDAFFREQRFDQVYLAAAKVGGIVANDTFPAEFIHDNLVIQTNVVHAAFSSGVRQLLFLGSSCIYPRNAEQPMSEAALLTGPLEATNEAYAVAKIAGIKMCESYNRQYGVDYRSVMPTNLYGENDNFDLQNSHVIPALIRRLHQAARDQAESVEVWGTGTPKREFLHVDDMAAASVHIMNLDSEVYRRHTQPMLSHVNVGTGKDVSIRELAEAISAVVGFEGELCFDSTKPDGAPRKLLDVSRVHRLGWRHQIGLEQGLRRTYEWFLNHQDSYRH